MYGDNFKSDSNKLSLVGLMPAVVTRFDRIIKEEITKEGEGLSCWPLTDPDDRSKTVTLYVWEIIKMQTFYVVFK